MALLLAATAVPGLLFAPVFGPVPLALPVAAVLVACYAVFELCERVTALRPGRPVLALLAGLCALAEVSLFDTTAGGVPTGETLRELGAGWTESWQLALQSTWPVRPEPELLLFVPLLVLVAASIGLELLRWPAVALLPSLLLLAASQAFVAVSGPVATGVAFGYAVVVAGILFTAARQAVVLTVAFGVVAGLVVGLVPTGPAYTVHQDRATHVPRTSNNPLDELAGNLRDGDTEVFSYTSDAPVDLWRLVVLDEFNGATWTAGGRFQYLGSELAEPADLAVATTPRSARITALADGPWLPSQPLPMSVDGVEPLVDQDTGMLALPDQAGESTYDLRWHEYDDAPALADAGVASVAPGEVGTVPDGITEVLDEAVRGARPTFRTALRLEQYLSDNYFVTKAEPKTPLPTGSGWLQLREFLVDTKNGTSEQFAASYVVLARMIGIPARLAVGYRAPAEDAGGRTVVRGEDAHAWPEVAVSGYGWVPLDPAGKADGASASQSPLAKATQRVRDDLPPPDEALPDVPTGKPAGEPAPGDGPSIVALVAWVGVALVALAVLALFAVPVAKFVRTARRRRRTGVAGVVGAWTEACDLLRAHGTDVTPGMTARDLANVTTGSIVDSLHRLAVLLDTALWSGHGAGGGAVAAAWSAVRDIRAELTGRPLRARLKAVFTPR
jgi:transglutaminase-like putative cysteine protease